MLTGLLVCFCNAKLVGRPRSGVPRYVCSNAPGYPSCGKTATNTKRTDEHIRDMALVALDTPAFLAKLRNREVVESDTATLVRNDERKLAELAEDWGQDKITRREWMAARVVVEQRLERNRSSLARESRLFVLAGFVGTLAEMYERWAKLNVSQRRAIIIAACVLSIKVNPCNPKKRWDPDRFDPEWVA